jgi:hypothetical protein
MDMKTRDVDAEAELDPQDIAALLESGLDSPRRAELIERLAASPANAALLADAVALGAELDASALAKRSNNLFRTIRWLAVAAGIAAIGILGWLFMPGQSDGSMPAARYAFQLAQRSSISAPPASWAAQPRPVYRGRAPEGSDAARDARIGALLVDLNIALRTGDQRASDYARAIANLIDGMDSKQLPGPAVGLFREIADSSVVLPSRAAALLQSSTELRMPGDDEQVRAGAWLEAARLAAAVRDSAFFRAKSNIEELRKLTGAAALPLDARQHLHVTDSALAAPRPAWPVIQAQFDSALLAVGADRPLPR